MASRRRVALLITATAAAGVAALLVFGRTAHSQENQPLTPRALQTALASRSGDASALAQQVRAYFGGDLKNGAKVKVDGLDVAFAIEAPGAKAAPRVVNTAQGTPFDFPLVRIGATDLYAGTTTLPDGAGMHWVYDVDGKQVGGANLEVYKTHPDSLPQPGVPKGVVTQMPPWKSTLFANTTRDWWVYVPAQYTPDKPACVMVWQDGGGAKNFAPPVFDNLIAKGDMPVTVGVFVNPGRKLDQKPEETRPRNRSFEYDMLSDQYARFLLEEILPEVEKTVKLRRDAASRAIAGGSSGGICAFTVAWERPNEFHKVLSWVGSFVNLQGGPTGVGGGHNYPTLIRKSKANPKPIRVFLSDGVNDLDNPFGNWPLANQQMDRALAFAGYDYKFVMGNGFHGGKFATAILPDSLRWLWRDYKPGAAAPATTAAK